MHFWAVPRKQSVVNVYCVLCVVYCVLCIVCCVLCIVCCERVLWIVYCMLCIVCCVLCIVYCVLWTCIVYCVLWTCIVYCALCIVCCERVLCVVCCVLCVVCCERVLWIVYCVLCIVCCVLCIVYCVLWTCIVYCVLCIVCCERVLCIVCCERVLCIVYYELVLLFWCGVLAPEFCPSILGTPCIFSEISTFTQCLWSWCYQLRRQLSKRPRLSARIWILQRLVISCPVYLTTGTALRQNHAGQNSVGRGITVYACVFLFQFIRRSAF
jgi:hypothetical protein